MIIKNISPYRKSLVSLNKFLMPGDECDLCEFTQKQRDDCIELQEGFRKGDFVCIGVGHKDNYNPRARLQAAKERLQKGGAVQPLVPIVGGDRTDFEIFEDSNPTHAIDRDKSPSVERKPIPYDNGEEKPALYRNGEENRPASPKGIEGFVVERDERGIFISKPIPTKPRPEELKPAPTSTESPTITPERIREILAQRCISFCTNGRKCRRWAVVGYEYCITHMPKKLLEEYKNKKKQQFFKD